MSAASRIKGLLWPLLCTGLLVGGLVYFCDLKQLWQSFSSLDAKSLGLLAGLYLLTQGLRAWRFQVLLETKGCQATWRLSCIVMVHQLGNHLLPFRLGELTFPFLCQRHADIPVAKASSALIQARIQEFYVLGCLFVVALFCQLQGTETIPTGRLAGIGMGVLLLGLLTEIRLPQVLRLAAKGLARFPMPRSLSGERFSSANLSQILEKIALASAQKVAWRTRLLGLLLTSLVWIGMFGLFHATMRSLGHAVHPAQTVLGSSFANLSQLLPINTFGSLGSLEAGWTLGFSLVGIAADRALASALVLHSLVIFLLLAFGSLGYLWLRSSRRLQ